MNHADFVHLRVHTAYSLTEGAIRVEQLAGLCVRHRMPAVAITDTNNLFGALEGSKALAGKGIQPIIGCQISLARLDQQTAFGKTLRKPDRSEEHTSELQSLMRISYAVFCLKKKKKKTNKRKKANTKTAIQ